MSIIKSNKGVAMAYVMMSLVVVFIVIAIVSSIAQANIKQASAQEKGLEAYYVARSGAELAYEAIMTTSPSLLDAFKADKNLVKTENGIDFEKGSADVTVTTSGTGDNQKIIIQSVGKLYDKDISKTVTLEFFINYDEKPGMVWSR
jgi:type II secretory pathway pseudopilin PulG